MEKLQLLDFFRNWVWRFILPTMRPKVYATSKVIRKKIIALLGNEAYPNGILDRAFVAKRIFEDPKLLQKVNDIIHPKVRHHFKRWLLKQKWPYCIKEAAILMENGVIKNAITRFWLPPQRKLEFQRVLKRNLLLLKPLKSDTASMGRFREKCLWPTLLLRTFIWKTPKKSS